MNLSLGQGFIRYYKGVLRNKEEPSVSSVVWNTGRLLVVGNLSQWEGRAQDWPYGEDVVKSVLGIPMHSGHEVLAVIGPGFEKSWQKRRIASYFSMRQFFFFV